MALRREIKRNKQERILGEAEQLFYERGFRGTTMDAIADAIGVTKPFVYEIYVHKIDILVAISLRIVNFSLATIQEARRAGGSPEEQLARFARNYTQIVIANQAGVAVFFREEATIPPAVTLALNEIKGRFDDELAELLAEGVSGGRFTVADVRMAGLAIGGMMSWIYIWYRDKGRLTPQSIADQMADYALGLVGARPRPNESPAVRAPA
jgi:AcrR family transcriptional regulator